MKRSPTIADRFEAGFAAFCAAETAEDFEVCAMLELHLCILERDCEILEIRLAFSHWRMANCRREHFAGFANCIPLLLNRLEKLINENHIG